MLKHWVGCSRARARRTLCAALIFRDTQTFRAAFDIAADAREALLRRPFDERQLPKHDSAWSVQTWCEGFALLRFAERDGLPVDDHSKAVPRRLRAPTCCG